MSKRGRTEVFIFLAFVLKIQPVNSDECIVSRGFFDVSNRFLPDEKDVIYQHHTTISPKQLTTRHSNQRYFLEYATLSLYSNTITADNFMVSNDWENIQKSVNELNIN